jgi:hypothetical protein
MSEYGRLWEEVSEIRRKLRKALPNAKLGTWEEARASVEAAGKDEELSFLLSEWAYFERKMARAEG